MWVLIPSNSHTSIHVSVLTFVSVHFHFHLISISSFHSLSSLTLTHLSVFVADASNPHHINFYVVQIFPGTKAIDKDNGMITCGLWFTSSWQPMTHKIWHFWLIPFVNYWTTTHIRSNSVDAKCVNFVEKESKFPFAAISASFALSPFRWIQPEMGFPWDWDPRDSSELPSFSHLI